MTRREFLLWSIASALFHRISFASDFNRFRVVQITIGNDPPGRPNAALVLAQEIRMRTYVDVRLDRVIVPLHSRAIFQYPFLFWVGEGGFRDLSDEEIGNLVMFTKVGGFILIDNAGEGAGFNSFDRQIRQVLSRAFPCCPLVKIPQNHVIFRSFYKIKQVCGRKITHPYLEGIFLDDRVSLVYSMNDLAGAWSRDGFGNWEFETVPGGQYQREESLRLGINIVMYSLLLDYKDEQAHIDYLLKRRILQPTDRK